MRRRSNRMGRRSNRRQSSEEAVNGGGVGVVMDEVEAAALEAVADGGGREGAVVAGLAIPGGGAGGPEVERAAARVLGGEREGAGGPAVVWRGGHGMEQRGRPGGRGRPRPYYEVARRLRVSRAVRMLPMAVRASASTVVPPVGSAMCAWAATASRALVAALMRMYFEALPV